ncbi:MAG: peptidylprolyl isomerase [Oscillospiraceae bacterium]|nr:peptidylprolyl isomerase [Oscillospiraceae bacterium]
MSEEKNLTAQPLDEQLEDKAETVKDKAEALLDAAEDKLEVLADTVEDKLDAAEDKLEALADAAEDKLEALADAAEEKAEALKKGVKQAAEKTGYKKSTRIVAVVALAVTVFGVFGLLLLSLFAPAKSPMLTGDTVLTVEGHEVSALEYNQYVASFLSSYTAYFGEDYFENEENFTYVLQQAESYFVDYYTLLAWAEEEGFTLTDEDKAYVEDTIAGVKANYGSEEAYQEALAASGLTDALYYDLLCKDMVRINFVDSLYDPETSPFAVPESELAAFCEANGIYGAKHIFFLFGEDDTADLAVQRRAQEVLARLNAGEDFDTLMHEFSEDPGLAQYPNGYTFAAGEMVDQFYAGTAALAVGEYSGIIASDSGGYHIIMRVEPDMEEAATRAMDMQLIAEFERRVAEADISYGKGYDKIAYSDFVSVPAE